MNGPYSSNLVIFSWKDRGKSKGVQTVEKRNIPTESARFDERAQLRLVHTVYTDRGEAEAEAACCFPSLSLSPLRG